MLQSTEKYTSVRMPAELQAKMKRLAKKHKRSMNAQIVWVLDQYAAEEEQKEKEVKAQ